MATIFTKIINGEIPAMKIAENDYALAFMDISPLRRGHVIVVPKIEVDEIYELEDKILGELIIFAKKISKAMKRTFNMRIGISVIGLEVPHAHIHLIPIETANDINFSQAKLQLSTEEIKKTADKIISNYI